MDQQQHQQAMNMMNTQPPNAICSVGAAVSSSSSAAAAAAVQHDGSRCSRRICSGSSNSSSSRRSRTSIWRSFFLCPWYVSSSSAATATQLPASPATSSTATANVLAGSDERNRAGRSICLSVCFFPNKILLPNPSSRFFFLVAKAESLSKQKKKKMQQIQMLSGVCNSSWICFWVESLADPFGVLNIFRKCVAPCPMESPVCLFFFLSFPSVIPWRMDSEAPGDLSSSLKDSGGACSSCSWWSFFPAWRIWEATDVIKFQWRIWQATDVVKVPWRIWSCLPPPLRFLWRIGEAPGSSWCFPQEFWKALGSSCKLLKIFPSRIREAPDSNT